MKRSKNVTAQDVANLAGVSRAVVSRALSDNGSIATETKAKVIKAAQELGYQVNFLAQGLNRKRSQLIGVVVTRISDPFRSRLLEELISVIQAQGYQALVTEIYSAQDLEATMRRFTQFRVSGVVVTSGQPPAALVAECVQFDIPVVGINRALDIPLVDFVCSDNQQAADLVVEHFNAHQCQTFGWLNSEHSTWSGSQRGVAFKKTLRLKGIAEENIVSLHASEDSYQGGFEAAARLHQNQQILPSGIFAANAQLACGFLDGMRAQGYEAPNDYLLIGFDNTPQTAQYSYRLTTLKQDIQALCQNSLECLNSRARQANLTGRMIEIPVQLIERHTSPTPETVSKDV